MSPLLESYAAGRWYAAADEGQPVRDAVTGDEVARISSTGLDLGAMVAHATQVDPTGRWFACPLDVQRATWPTEDFQLARSLVDTPLPEDDLFAGVRETVAR